MSTSNALNNKRKRDDNGLPQRGSLHVQIVVGSYERALHGFTASLPVDALDEDQPREKKRKINASPSFRDNFLLNAHTSSIRCLAISPPSSEKRILATGGADERVNLFQLQSTIVHSNPDAPSELSVLDAPRSRSLGTLLHHTTPVSHLSFLGHNKLLSGAGDNQLAITGTRDWTLMSTLKAPFPKQPNRPSGDTSVQGEAPGGVNDVAIHPSSRLAVSVHRGEACIRLWDLVKGKKAGVLSFDKGLLAALGESKWKGGEGRSVEWRHDGEQFFVACEKGVALFGGDCKIRGIISLGLRSKVARVRYLPSSIAKDTLALSTEDGRLMFYDTGSLSAVADDGDNNPLENVLDPIAQLCDSPDQTASKTRIKDFAILEHSDASTPAALVITASSDGNVRFFGVQPDSLQSESTTHNEQPKKKSKSPKEAQDAKTSSQNESVKRVGNFLGIYNTSWRITCLEAFVLETRRATSKEAFSRDREASESEESSVDKDEDGILINHEDEDNEEEEEEEEAENDGEWGGFE